MLFIYIYMKISDDIELNDKVELMEIDKEDYFDWLVKYIDNGGEIDEYYDRKFDDDEWYYAEGEFQKSNINVMVDEINVDYTDNNLYNNNNVFNLYDYTCNGSVPIYNDMLVDFAERYPEYILNLSKQFESMNVDYVTENKSPEDIVSTTNLQEELTVNGNGIGYTKESDVDFWESVKNDKYLKIMYQQRCDFCEWNGEVNSDETELDKHNHKDPVMIDSNIPNNHTVRKARVVSTHESNIYPDGFYTKREFSDMVENYEPESEIQYPFTRIKDDKIINSKPTQGGNHIFTDDEFIYTVKIPEKVKKIKSLNMSEKVFKRSKYNKISEERSSISSTIMDDFMDDFMEQYPTEIVKDYLDTDELSLKNVRRVSYGDIKDYEYKYYDDRQSINIPSLLYGFFFLFLIVLYLVFSNLIILLYILLIPVAFAVINVKNYYNIDIVEKRRKY